MEFAFPNRAVFFSLSWPGEVKGRVVSRYLEDHFAAPLLHFTCLAGMPLGSGVAGEGLSCGSGE